MKGKRIPEPPKPKAEYLTSPSVEEKRIAELEAQLAEVTEQRDLWAKQCNMASEAQADALSHASQLIQQVKQLEASAALFTEELSRVKSRFGALIEEARTVLSREAANGREVVAHEWARRVLVAAGEVEP